VRIDQRSVPLDDAPPLELPNTLQDRRGRQALPTLATSLRNPGVLLKKIQNRGVYFVNHSVLLPSHENIYHLFLVETKRSNPKP
jgi:hypothetical protein